MGTRRNLHFTEMAWSLALKNCKCGGWRGMECSRIWSRTDSLPGRPADAKLRFECCTRRCHCFLVSRNLKVQRTCTASLADFFLDPMWRLESEALPRSRLPLS